MYMYTENPGLESLNDDVVLAGYGGLILQTLGIRSAGSNDGVAFLAGPGSGGINMFAFDAETGAFLRAETIPGCSNVRKWLVASDGELYVGFGGCATGGEVWRWIGNKDGEPTYPNLFNFEVVAEGLDGDAAELAEHDNNPGPKIFVSTWPGGGPPAGIWMSPASIGPGTKGDWVKVFNFGDYEPDPVTAVTYGGGAVASFDGWLYWGTMHVPGVATLAHEGLYGPALDEAAQAQSLIGTWRAITIFRGKDFGEVTEEIELLYGGSSIFGAKNLRAYLCPGATFPGTCDPATMTWQTVPNNMGLTPKYGLAGFNNVFNNYTWIMEVWNNALYVGTMDHSYLVLGAVGELLPPGLQPLLDSIPGVEFGADLYRFDDSNSSAVAVSLDGLGNPMNYGIRTSVSSNPMYLGTANPMNLNPDGGWQLIKLTEAEATTCAGYCGGESPSGCYCDDLCTGYGDCCSDYQQLCQ